MQVKFFAEPQQEGAARFMTEPVVDATSVYIGRNAAATAAGPGETLVSALAADLQQWAITWQVKLAAAITADLALGSSDAVHPHRGDDRRAEHRRRVDQVVASAQRLSGAGAVRW